MQAIEELEDLTNYLRENKNDYHGFIYITTNLINGKKYIGQKKIDSGYRWNTYLGSGKLLLKAIDKYGGENFRRKIVDISKCEDELNTKEKEWIKRFDAVKSEDYYNLIDGGISGKVLSANRSWYLVCIDNNFIFKSLLDASRWARCTPDKIKDTFGKKHNIKLEKKQFIFKVLFQLKKNHKLCAICACNFLPNTTKDKYCNKCLINENFDSSKYEFIENKFQKTLSCYSIEDEWVKEELDFYEKHGIEPCNSYSNLRYKKETKSNGRKRN